MTYLVTISLANIGGSYQTEPKMFSEWKCTPTTFWLHNCVIAFKNKSKKIK
jgi:hypothetical protein